MLLVLAAEASRVTCAVNQSFTRCISLDFVETDIYCHVSGVDAGLLTVVRHKGAHARTQRDNEQFQPDGADMARFVAAPVKTSPSSDRKTWFWTRSASNSWSVRIGRATLEPSDAAGGKSHPPAGRRPRGGLTRQYQILGYGGDGFRCRSVPLRIAWRRVPCAS